MVRQFSGTARVSSRRGFATPRRRRGRRSRVQDLQRHPRHRRPQGRGRTRFRRRRTVSSRRARLPRPSHRWSANLASASRSPGRRRRSPGPARGRDTRAPLSSPVVKGRLGAVAVLLLVASPLATAAVQPSTHPYVKVALAADNTRAQRVAVEHRLSRNPRVRSVELLTRAKQLSTARRLYKSLLPPDDFATAMSALQQQTRNDVLCVRVVGNAAVEPAVRRLQREAARCRLDLEVLRRRDAVGLQPRQRAGAHSEVGSDRSRRRELIPAQPAVAGEVGDRRLAGETEDAERAEADGAENEGDEDVRGDDPEQRHCDSSRDDFACHKVRSAMGDLQEELVVHP